ncbi:MAG: hypothetical protein K2H75_08385 [Muribaculaceae bacterium]|nr:hypothetical protein [Muribaculaceae bacterium]
MNIEKTAASLSRLTGSAASLLKVALRSRRVPTLKTEVSARPLTVMGNGPSLRGVLDGDRAVLRDCDLMAVNFAPNTSAFFELKPQYLVLADPHFFNVSAADSDPNVIRLWENLHRVSWPLQLLVPVRFTSVARTLAYADGQHKEDNKLQIKTFNTTPAEGLRSVSHWLFDRRLAMPRPRNVLIASLMLGIWLGYKDIRIVGADHTWSQSLWVDDMNRVVSVQPHFYEDKKDELDRVAAEYAGYHLHDILRSLTVAFESYHHIAAYAVRHGVKITNLTPGSMIDAFPRSL